MKPVAFLLLVGASIALGGPLSGVTPSLAQTPVVTPCEGLQGQDARDCLKAYELLTSEPKDRPAVDLSISVSRSADGWRYRFADGGGAGVEETCPDNGPLTLPGATRVELLLTGGDTLYEWSVPALGLKAALIPGRIESVVTVVEKPGDFAGELTDITGAPMKSADGSLKAVEQAAFDVWKAAVSARRC